ncbi:sugar kinase [Falsiroseomonas bella]|uniref:Sugar kinase n=1 Tax=Falsiroseomonas bella TaxID=2184016 RepID=A0A317F9Z5_9PROT|nr:PfkB family carbohydrate kinase [Falsiroseomonas bella]PWS35615.1 sugar kinase [Falsiroseomonas bella]
MKHKVVCSGIAVLDRVYSFERLPLTPGKHIARGYRENGGGMAATAAVSIVALGGRASWFGRLGADATGETLLGMLRRLGVEADGATIVPGGQSPSAGVTLDAEGERVLCVYPGSNLPEEAPIPPEALDGAGAVLADPRWVNGAEQVFAMARARGLPSVLDAELGPSHILQRLAPQAGHAVFSERGLVDFTGIAEPEAGLARAAATLPGIVAVTLGARGSLWWQRGDIVALPAPRIVACDTTGCGDVFHGAYALALAEGADTLPAARFATAAAALKAANGNGWEGMPDRAAVEALLREAW